MPIPMNGIRALPASGVPFSLCQERYKWKTEHCGPWTGKPRRCGLGTRASAARGHGRQPPAAPGREPRELRHADTEEDLRACFAVMRELRPHLQGYEDFAARVRRMRGEGYRLLAGWQADVPVALAGYRLQENLVYGPFFTSTTWW